MFARKLLIVTALAETPIGLLLLMSPALVAQLLLGASLDAPAAIIVGRVAGAALLSLSTACWLARDGGPGLANRGLIAAMLLYNCVAGAVLVHAAVSEGLIGMLMWPAIAVHALLGGWCIVCSWKGPANTSSGTRSSA